ncbi:hypothetical protein dqs_2280 [Azoarcus olearius]|uniref:hypothetical protein n=1 Tax=Azoarcus sp. (strain BH72) TaxID=418699 RepID=UPI00080636F4|nr:hypothetical protein [Azoarcus olearius]ANQ85311.1 hypothetical protein dqs_2280 [Azoarcus olearius]
MRSCLAPPLLALLLTLLMPAHAAPLQFQLAGQFETATEPPQTGPLTVSYELREGPAEALFGAVTAPDGTVLPDYFLGTTLFSESIDSTSNEPFGPIGPVTVRFGDNAPLVLKPFSLTQSISALDFNRYRYDFEVFMQGSGLFGLFQYALLIAPPAGVPYLDRDFVSSLATPIELLALAALGSASGMFELSQFNITADFTRVLVTAVVAEPGALAVLGAALLGLLVVPRRRTALHPG